MVGSVGGAALCIGVVGSGRVRGSMGEGTAGLSRAQLSHFQSL